MNEIIKFFSYLFEKIFFVLYKLDKKIYDKIKNGEPFYSVNPTKALYALLKILYLYFLFL